MHMRAYMHTQLNTNAHAHTDVRAPIDAHETRTYCDT